MKFAQEEGNALHVPLWNYLILSFVFAEETKLIANKVLWTDA
jgi:hypothetical protein